MRRVIHFSAMGVEKDQPSNFSRAKLRGDEFLAERDLEWVILRPSIVLDPGAFGASALFRGLASLPTLMPETGKLQVVQLDDVVSTVSYFLLPQAPTRLALEIAGPEVLTFEDVVCCYRRWLGWKVARPVIVPKPLAGLMYATRLVGLYRAEHHGARWRPVECCVNIKPFPNAWGTDYSGRTTSHCPRENFRPSPRQG